MLEKVSEMKDKKLEQYYIFVWLELVDVPTNLCCYKELSECVKYFGCTSIDYFDFDYQFPEDVLL